MTTPQRIPFINLLKEHAPFNAELEEAALRVIRSGWYLRGPETKAFESRLAGMLSVDHAVGCSNGLDALRLIFKAYVVLGYLRPGDRVIVPANTYIASLLPVTEFGLTPVLVEPDPRSFGLDFHKADEIMAHDDIKAVMLVHLYGIPCWNGDICRKWSERGVLIIEDNAQAIGAQAATPGLYGSRFTGALGNASASSFYPTKNAGALGDAGAVTTGDEQLAQTVRALANYGSDRRYHNIHCGYNCRIDELHAAMLSVVLDNLDSINLRRRHAAAIYDKNIRNTLITKPLAPEGCVCVWHQYTILCEHRDILKQYLEIQGVATDIHYAVPPHLQPCYASLRHSPLPITENIADSILSLPIQALDDDQLLRVADSINRFSI